MTSRRSSTNTGPGHATPRPTSSSFGDGRSPSLVPDQRASVAITVQMVGTESSQSESSLPESPTFPRPHLSLEASPHHSVNRQLIQPNTCGPLDSPSQSQQSNIPMPTPSTQTSFRSPTSMRTRRFGGFIRPSDQPDFDEGEGEFISSPNHPPPGEGVGGFAYPRRHYPHPPNYGSADISRGIHAKVWHTYNKVAQEFDEKKLKKWNKDLDTLLIFAALFSAIITAFLITALSDLGPNYQQQSALLLYQSLNGRDPNLASMSNPTAPFQPSGFAITVNLLWSASLSASLGASFIAVVCKEWLAEYNSCTNVAVDLLQACWRQHRFFILHKLKIHFIISLLPPLLHSSVILFFSGAVVYFWQIDVRVAIVYLVAGGIFCITYLISTFVPIVMNAPFRPYSAQLIHRSSVSIGGVIGSIADDLARSYFLALRCVVGAIRRVFPRITFAKGALRALYQQTRTIPPRGSKDTQDWWADTSSDSLDVIEISQMVQEEAILWLSQMPLDPSESEDVVSSLALISRPHKFPKSMVMFVYFTLDSWLREGPGKRHADPAINCVILLGHIKYQSVVDQNSDEDHNIGGIPVTPLVAQQAQRFATDACNRDFNTPQSEEIRARLLTAAAWLSPVEAKEEEMLEGEKLEIQDRRGFLNKIRATLEQHLRGQRPLDNSVLVNLIHGMHACIPRGKYGSRTSTISFLPLFCEKYGSPWLEDECVLRTLITYILDLLLPPEKRKPLVERKVEFLELASELIDVLKANANATDVITFGFWLIYHVPYAFTSRKSILVDIVCIWTLATTPGDHRTITIMDSDRKRINSLAINSFIAAAQYQVVVKATVPRLAADSTLNLLSAALKDDHSRFKATYAVAMILNLGSSTRAVRFAQVNARSFTDTLHATRSDLEANATEEDTLDFHIYSTLVLLKLQERPVDADRVRALIREMKGIVGEPSVGGPRTEIDVDLDRVRWKAIYLSGILFEILPPDERGEPIEILRGRVRTLLQARELSPSGDYKHCIRPLDMAVVEAETSPEGEETTAGLPYSAFDRWINGFPLLPLFGSILNEK